jgi:hypothetical protein
MIASTIAGIEAVGDSIATAIPAARAASVVIGPIVAAGARRDPASPTAST